MAGSEQELDAPPARAKRAGGERESRESRAGRAHRESSAVVERAIEVEAPPQEVWDALASEQGRERWLQEPDRAVVVEIAEEPRRLVWWWGSEGERPTRVEFRLAPAVAGTRVLVTESAPDFPISMFAAQFVAVLA